MDIWQQDKSTRKYQTNTVKERIGYLARKQKYQKNDEINIGETRQNLLGEEQIVVLIITKR